MEVRVITTMAPWCLLCVPGLAGSTASEPGGAMHLPLRLLMLERRCNLKSTVLNTITRGRWIYNHEYSILKDVRSWCSQRSPIYSSFLGVQSKY